jgi:DNA-binding NarL/FixJ family response regulator
MSPDEGDAREMIAAGAFAYFGKPFNLDEIEQAVDRAISRHQELKSQTQAKLDATAIDPGHKN